MRGYLMIRIFVADISLMRNFHSTCNFNIIMLNDEILTKSEQNLKFLKQIKSTFLARNGL